MDEQYIDIGSAQALRVQSEGEVATILSNFSTEYIFGVIQDLLQQRRDKFLGDASDNFVDAYEQAFKNMKATYPGDIENIEEIRDNTYENIINMICKEFKLEPVYREDEDKLALAHFLFDFFISNYGPFFCEFYIRMIRREKDSLYNYLEQEDASKSKDITTSFNKNLYKDQKIAIIAANIGKTMSFINSLDLSMEEVLQNIYDMNVVMLFSDHLKPVDNFLMSAYSRIISNPSLSSVGITIIKYKLQQLATAGQI